MVDVQKARESEVSTLICRTKPQMPDWRFVMGVVIYQYLMGYLMGFKVSDPSQKPTAEHALKES